MLRPRPHRIARGVLAHPAIGWLALAVLYLAAAGLNLLLAVSTSRMWPIVLAALLIAVAGLCVTAAARRLRE